MMGLSTINRLNRQAALDEFREKNPDIEIVSQDEADEAAWEARADASERWERVADDLVAQITTLTERILTLEQNDQATRFEMAAIVDWAECQTGDI
jgi:hypothetical protein